MASAVAAADDAGLAAAAWDLDETEALSSLTRGPGSTDAARWRITLIFRQAVEDYWQPLLAPRGKILPSILLTYGVYCRLENISGDGKWLSAAARWGFSRWGFTCPYLGPLPHGVFGTGAEGQASRRHEADGGGHRRRGEFKPK